MKNLEKDGVVDIPATPFAFFWLILRPHRGRFGLIILLVFVAQLFSDLNTYVISKFIDSATLYENGDGTLRNIFLWLLAAPALQLLTVGLYRISGFLMNFLNADLRSSAIRRVFSYLSLHTQGYFNDRFSGVVATKVGNVSGNVPRLVSQIVWSILSLIFSFFISLFLIGTANKTLAAAFAVGFFVLVPINILITRKQIALAKKSSDLGSKLRGYIVDVITNIAAVQQYARRSHEIARLDGSINEHRDALLKTNNFREGVLAFNNLLVGTFILIIVIWAFKVWSGGGMSIGNTVMVVTLTMGFMWSLTRVGQNINDIMEFYGEMKDGLEEIVVPHTIIDNPGSINLVPKQEAVEFDNVTFSYYEDESNSVLSNFSLLAKSGEKIGIVGKSGSGKTTLMKLLLRQHDVTKGAIRIDGQDIRNLTQESLREHISVVPQEPMLFHRTIRENIMYGKLDASEDDMIEVAKKAQAHNFIEALPQKYDSLVGERGVKLSVGQRQRIAIARAFVKDAPILILDEATSALDSESEVAVQKALEELMKGKTVFAVAHRLSTLREMDRIIVLKDGQIVEDGSHLSLLKNKEGVYSSLWAHQAGGFIKEE